jgi:hypothetical protein
MWHSRQAQKAIMYSEQLREQIPTLSPVLAGFVNGLGMFLKVFSRIYLYEHRIRHERHWQFSWRDRVLGGKSSDVLRKQYMSGPHIH